MKYAIDALKKELVRTQDHLKSDKQDLEEAVNNCTRLNDVIKQRMEKIQQIERAITLLGDI